MSRSSLEYSSGLHPNCPLDAEGMLAQAEVAVKVQHAAIREGYEKTTFFNTYFDASGRKQVGS